MKKFKKIFTSIFIMLVLGIILIPSFSTKALTEGEMTDIPWFDSDYWLPTEDNDNLVVYWDFANDQIKLVYDLGYDAVRIDLPTSTTFIETEAYTTPITEAWISANTIDGVTEVFYMEKYNLFTFSKSTYLMYLELKSEIVTQYDTGYDLGYDAGLLATEPTIFNEGKEYGIDIGRNQMFLWGADYYGFDQNNSRDYVYGLYDGYLEGLADTNDALIEDIYDNGFTAYTNPDTDLPYTESGSYSFAQGTLASEGEAYDLGYTEGGNDAFTANLHKWIVPAIIIVLVVGGFISYSKMRKSD